ncbi:hypothetical protein P389DRAFT_212895 [Cystobasidium minutum MCA 4210]|uniref:uncharacterized protein n=1 Tax=Cystobasidium minutum MCA 4210 TaxID=1397322 RepID=UPI0034CE39AC|eukprot:jgi/Rhomi1/212895/estExt_Genemark1.C_80107
MDNGPPPYFWDNKHDRYITVHAILGSLAALVTAPTAILVARYFRSWRHWNSVHLALNAFTAIFIVIAFALANVAVGDPHEYSGDGADLHHQLGLAIFIITLVQTILGIGVRFTKSPPFNYVTLQPKRNAIRYIHIAFGIATAAILYVQVYTGFDEWDQASASQTTVPRGVTIVFWVLFSIEVFAYVVGWIVMEPLAWRKRKNYLLSHPDSKDETVSQTHLMS